MDEGQTSLLNSTPVNQDPAALRAARARERWRGLGMAIRGVSPSDLAHLLLVIIGFAGVGWLVWNTWFALLPFQIGLVLAYIVLPAVNGLDRVMPRSWAVILVLLAGLCVIVLFFGLLIPATAQEVQVTVQNLPTREEVRSTLNRLALQAQSLPPPVQTFIRDSLQQQYANVQQNINVYAQRLIGTALTSVLSLFSVVSFLLGFLVLPTWLMSVLGDQKSGVRALRRALPRWLAGDFWAVLRIFDRAFGVILRGQIWRALATTVLTWIGLVLIERLGFGPFQYKLLLAMWLGLFSLIPNIGILIGAVPLVGFGLLQSPQLAVVMLLLVVVVQQLESRLVSSRIESRVVDIHPAILVPALVAASQFGIFWVFVATPLLVVVRDLFRYTYGRVSDPPARAGILPTGESVLEVQAKRERARQTAKQYARPSGKAAPVPAGPARPTGNTQS